MKIAVTGKGGVGKTTVAAALCGAFVEKGYRVMAIDADPDANLASALGFPESLQPAPISEMKELIEERTGAKPGTSGGFFKLNPKVDDLPERLGREFNGVRLLRMGTVKKGGSGCMCAESVLLKSLVQHLFLFGKEAVVMDMEAGIEHLGRATAQAVDQFIVVVEPGMRSIETALKIKALGDDIGVGHIYGIGNKLRDPSDKVLLEERMKGITMLGYIPFDERTVEADFLNRPVWGYCQKVTEVIREVVNILTSTPSSSQRGSSDLL